MSAAVPPVWSTWHPLGHLPKFLDDPVELFTEAHRLHGPVASMRLATNTVLTINDPGAARALLLEHQRNFVKRTPGYTVLRRLLGDGLVTAMGDDWKRKRRIANPAFHRRCLAGFVDTMNASTEDWLARIDAELPEGPIDLHPEMVKLTLTIAGITLFHVDLTEDSDEVSQAVRTALDAFNSLVASSLPLLAWLPTPTNRRMNEAVARLDKVVQGIIEGRRRTPSEHTDLLAMLMGLEDTETGSRLNDKELRDEVVTTLLAGHETTANGLAWALWLLAGHPEVADAVAAEVRAHTPEGALGLSEIGELPLLQATIRETLRLYPPVWLMARRSVESCELGGFSVPADTVVFFSPWLLHRDPSVWPDPERFDPSRFTDADTVKARPAGSYMPFSAGSRKCIGDRFAEAEMAVVLGQLLRRFELRRADGHDPGRRPSVTLGPEHGTPIVLTRRPS